MKMVRITPKLCASCKYRINVEQKASCNYLEVTGQSRIFKNGRLTHDPNYCDKYEKGDKLPGRDIAFGKSEYDEYERCKAERFGADTLGSRNRGMKKRERTDMYEG